MSIFEPRLTSYQDLDRQLGLSKGEVTWTVGIVGMSRCILAGFGRRVDAEIAIRFLESLPVCWSYDAHACWAQLNRIGYTNRRQLMEAACERLQW